MKDTSAIIYDAGAYGNFINWCCAYFSGLTDDINTPFTDTGSVHNSFLGNSGVMYAPQIKEYINSVDTIPFLQVHQDNINEHSAESYIGISWFNSLVQDLDYISKNFKHSIYVYPTSTSISWIVNNAYYKIKPFQDHQRLQGSGDLKEFYRSMGVSEQRINELAATEIDRLRLQLSAEVGVDNLAKWGHTNIDQFALWELRELSAEYFYDRCCSKLFSKEQLDQLKFNNIKLVPLDQLRTNFILEMSDILEFFNIAHDIDQLKDIHTNWLGKQQHIDKDQQILEVITALVQDIDLDWTSYNFTFFDEVFIQRLLLDQKIEVACYNLDKFPTTTKDFKPLLITDN
jgi:hypothetical protein